MMQNLIKILFVACLMLLIPSKGKSQNWEIGAFVGATSNYSDPSNDIYLENMRYAIMGFARKHLDKHFALRFNLAFVRIAGIDSISESSYQRNRNLNFFTDIYEGSVQLEYNLLEDKTRGRRIKNRTIPYVFIGLGLAYYTPKTIYLGTEYVLAGLQTGGKSYSQLCGVMPLGVGVRYYITPRWLIGLEMSGRFTTTGYLDDIESGSEYPDPATLPSDLSRLLYDRSNQPRDPDTGIGYGQPGFLRSKIKNIPYDIYGMIGITLSYKFNIVGGSRVGGRALRCPRFY